MALIKSTASCNQVDTKKFCKPRLFTQVFYACCVPLLNLFCLTLIAFSCKGETIKIMLWAVFRKVRELLGDLKHHAVRANNYCSNFFIWDTCNGSAKLRLIFIACAFSLCFVVISYRLVTIASHGYTRTKNNHTRHQHFRREIVDRNGNLLAVNLPSASLFANPQLVLNPEYCIDKLSNIIQELDKKKLLSELQSSKTFVWIKRDLTPKEQGEIFNLGLPGFDFEREQKRVYIFGNLLSHVIGYVGRDFAGLAGLEKYYDEMLSNRDVVNGGGDKNDKPLQLTIDIRLQNILNEEINRVLTEFQAKGAVGIIADPNNGEILALVSKPDFDPHYPHQATPQQLFNMASLGVFEMGSVIKALTMAIGLDSQSISLHDAYDITHMRVGKFQIKDYHPMRGWHTVPEIFLHSSNIGVGQIMLEVGKPVLKKYLKTLGLLDQLRIELPERGTPLFPSDNRWNDLSTVTMSYGYGFSISPLHFIQAIMPVVNGGNMYPLTLIKKENKAIELVNKVFRTKTSNEMRKLFRLVVQEGTGRKADVKGYLVGGKTGTAEKLAGKKYNKNSRISSFLGVMPASNPDYVIYIMFDEPKGTKESFGFATAGWTAAPAVGRVLERMIALYGLSPVDENNEEVQEILNIEYKINDKV